MNEQLCDPLNAAVSHAGGEPPSQVSSTRVGL